MGNNTKRVNWEGLLNDPEYKKNYNWYIDANNMRIIEDSLIGRNANYAQRAGVLSLIVPESGGRTAPHGNGAFGLIGWRGIRSQNLPTTILGQSHKLMQELFEPTKSGIWTDGGAGTNVKTGKEMQELFQKTENSLLATKAVMKGYVRPPKGTYNTRLSFLELLKRYMK